ncbi:low-density lipoprotein receptor-related protein 4-like isoform X2 [Mya arenaria]|uniref:low-density lipoprotein receptor-related protein 4-like isoform X2 n=1 Tax=Mya arenaria TaxID=6604 RepID=UPI0022E33388|nr:low-density lipoprotein receptor-related protein 4-like isoform X2 [Mya arenaria]
MDYIVKTAVLVCGLSLSFGAEPVYVSNGTHIVSYSRDGPEIKAVLGQRDYRIVGLAVDVAKGYLFWSDISPRYRGVYRSNLYGNEAVKLVDDVGEINGLTVDWVSQHVYWTDAERRTVEVSDYEGRSRRVLVSTDLQAPRGIVASPLFGFLFWADQRSKRIERSLLDGTKRRTLVKYGQYWPNQLAVHNKNKRLYWVDASEHAVISCSLSGKHVREEVNYGVVAKNAPGFGLLVFGNTALISTWFNTGLYSLLLGGKKLVWQQEATGLGTRDLYSIVSLNPSTQPMTYHVCMEEDRGGCSHLCLPSSRSLHVCACPTYGGLTLLPDGKTCAVPDEILLTASAAGGTVGFLPLDAGRKLEPDFTVVGSSSRPFAVGYDPVRQTVYWSDGADRAIYMSSLIGSDQHVLLDHTHGLGKVSSIQYVAETGSLYFLNIVGDGYASLERVTTPGDNSRRVTLVRNLDKPVDFTVDAEKSVIYVATDGGEPKIIRTDLEGGNFKEFRLKDGQTPVGVAAREGAVIVAVLQNEGEDRQTVLEEVDLDTGTLVSTPLHNTSISDLSVGPEVLYLTGSDVIMYLNSSHPGTLYRGFQASDILYTKTSAQNSSDDIIHACMGYGCPCDPAKPNDLPCSCGTGSVIDTRKENTHCSTLPDNMLLFADVNTINLLPLDNDVMSKPLVLHYGDVDTRIDSIAYDNQGHLYWNDELTNSIFMTSLHNIEPVLVYRDEGPISGLQLDSFRGRLYWVGELGSDWFIATLNLEKGLQSYRRILKLPHEISTLALHPIGKWLYFIERDGAGVRVSSCKTSGRRYRQVVTDGLLAPSSLHITDDRMYIGENTGGIVVYRIQDVAVEDVYLPSTGVSGLLVHNNHVVFSDDVIGDVKSYSMITKKVQVLASGLRRPGSLLLRHPKDMDGACEKEGVVCSDICVSMFLDDFRCTCYKGRELAGDGFTCLDTVQPTSHEPVASSTDVDVTSTANVIYPKPDVNPPESLPQNETTTNIYSSTNFKQTFINPETSSVSSSPIITVSTAIRATTAEEFELTNGTTVADEENKEYYNVTSAVTSRSTDVTSVVTSGSPGAGSRHSGEPRPTQPTVASTDQPEEATTSEEWPHVGLIDVDLYDTVRADSLSSPYFENCPENETIIVTLPTTDSITEIPIRPAGYSSDGTLLAVHGNFEMTDNGFLVRWLGEQEDSRHDAVFSVTDSLQQTAKCHFRIILQDVDEPQFTYCPDTVKVRTDQISALVNWTIPEVRDNTGLRLVTSSNSPGNHFRPGEHLVNYTAVDYAGNKASCLFSVFVLHDTFCNLPPIEHGGVICSHGDEVHGDCRVICEGGFAVSPLRAVRRVFNCKRAEDVDAVRTAVEKHQACIKNDYPSVLAQEYRVVFNGPIHQHKDEIHDNLNMAISNHLKREELCDTKYCNVTNITLRCDVESDVIYSSNVTCLDEQNRTEFFIVFNVSLRNDTKIQPEVDLNRQLERIELEVLSLTSVLHVQVEGHMFTAIPDSLVSSPPVWACPPGRVPENGICISCPPGTFHNTSSGECEYCSTGRYQPASSQIACQTCSPGRRSPPGAISSEQCHMLPSMDEMTLFIIVTTCSFGVVFLCMAVTLYLQFQRQQKRNQQPPNQKKTRYNITPNMYVAPPPILKSKLDENFTHSEKTYSIDRKQPVNIFSNHDYDDLSHYKSGSPFQHDVLSMLQSDYSPGDELPTANLSRENTFSNPTYSPLGFHRNERGSLQRTTPSPGPQRKMSHDSTFSNQSPRMGRAFGTPTSDTPLITQSPLLRMKLAAYNLNHED